MAPDNESIRELIGNLKKGKDVKVKLSEDGKKAEVIIETTGDEAREIIRQLDAEKEGMSLAEYVKGHAEVAVTKGETDRYKVNNLKYDHEDKKWLNQNKGMAFFEYTEGGDSIILFFVDKEQNLNRVILPFEQITQFKKEMSLADDRIEVNQIMEVLKEAGLSVVMDSAKHWKACISAVEEGRRKEKVEKIEL